MRYLLIILLIINFVVLGAEISLEDCAREKNIDKKQLCMSVATSNATGCDKINNLDLHASCISQVRDKGRRITWSIIPLNDKNAERR